MTISKSFDRAQGGFTLIELMIAVVVVSILAMIAIPAYNDSVNKGRRSDAKSTLTAIAAKQEQFFMDNKRYTADLKELGYTASSSVDSIDGYYKITSAIVASPPAFTLTAVPDNSDSDCGNFTLDEKGSQGVSGSKGAALCW